MPSSFLPNELPSELPNEQPNPLSTLLPNNWLELSADALAYLAPIQKIEFEPLQKRGISLSLKREDLLDAKLGGNKLYKLSGHLQRVKTWSAEHKCPSFVLASFGGAYSNHLYSLAALAQTLSIPVFGFVRGTAPSRPSATLKDLSAMRMHLVFLPRSEYRKKDDAEFRRYLQEKYIANSACYWIPEGGGGVEGARCCASLTRAILAKSPEPVNTIACAVGTGTTLAGMASAAPQNVEIFGVSVLKNALSLDREILSLLEVLAGSRNYCLNHQFHAGGYAKLSPELLGFIREFEEQTKIVLDPVYTAKLLWGIVELAKQGYWQEHTHIVALHSGGLQGRRGYPELIRVNRS